MGSRAFQRKTEWFINYGAYILTLAIEFAIMFRYYWWKGDYYSFDCILQYVIIGLADIPIFCALNRATNSDPGFAPKYKGDSSENADVAKDICHKCDALRKDPFVHHCSMCRGCIEFMDHHCVFIGKCVGRKNFKYFLQYCTSIAVLMLYALFKLMHIFYTTNVEHNEGL